MGRILHPVIIIVVGVDVQERLARTSELANNELLLPE